MEIPERVSHQACGLELRSSTCSLCVHAFYFISNTFIRNTRLKFAYFETRISENMEN